MSPAERQPPVVLLVCDYSLEYVGGAQTAFIRQARALSAEGWTVVAVAPGAEAVFAREETARIVAVSPTARFTLPHLGLPVLERLPQLRYVLDALVVDHAVTGIVVHSEFALATAALDVGAARSIPVLHTVHTFFWRAPTVFSPLAPLVRAYYRHITGSRAPAHSGSTPINNALRSMTLSVARRADIVLSPSRHQAAALRAAGVASTRTLSNVSEPEKTEPESTEPREPADGAPLTLVWAARFAREKRLPVALRAMRRVRARLGPARVRLHVAGGDHAPRPDVAFHGRVPTARVSELIEAADAVLITSLGFDNQPMVALEAFARGRPAIVTDPVLHEEFGDAAILSPTPDAAGLARAIERVEADRSLARAAGRAAVSYAASRRSGQHAAALRAAFADASAGRRESTSTP